MTNPFQLSPEEHDAIYRLIEARYLPKSQPQEQPTAIITGGQPGSGKSGITTQAKSELAERGGYVLIDADKLRTFSPLYRAALEADDREAANLTHADAGRWSQRLTLAGAQGRRNLIIDQTSKDAASVENLAGQLKGAGYRVELRVMAVNERFSEQRIHTRYEEQKAIQGHGRFSTKNNHDAAYVGVASAVEAIEQRRSVDALYLYDKNHHRISENTLQDGEWTRPMTAARSMQAERNRPLTLDERQELADQYDRLAAMVEAPERAALPEQRETLSALRASAHNDLESVTAKVSVFKAAAAYSDDRSPMDAIVRQGTMIEVELRHEELGKSPTADRVEQIARADLQDFNYLAGKPEQLQIAVAMRSLMDNPDYRSALLDAAPDDFQSTLDAAQLAADDLPGYDSPQLSSDYDLE
ncbi:TPA: zeta toxin family protein [Pseudomonas aeruginosa]|nr:zeta toxin family protein [Pseudomonas aeruginosa]